MAHAAKGKMVTLPRTKNLSTGKESMHQTGFSDASWGFASHAFAKSARRLNDDKFGCLMNDTQAFVKPTHAWNRSANAATETNLEEDDERACLIYYSGSSDSDSESACK